MKLLKKILKKLKKQAQQENNKSDAGELNKHNSNLKETLGGNNPEEELKAYCKSAAMRKNLLTEVHGDDLIFQFLYNNQVFNNRHDAIKYYFEDGEKSAKQLAQLLFDELSLNKNKDTSLLEFASGYGCVTRHLVHYLQEIELLTSDIHPEANNFISSKLGVESIQSASKPEQYPKNRQFNAVFALSFFSHMPKNSWTRWLETLFSLVKDDGYLIFTTQGLASRSFHGDPEIPKNGFWFHADSEQKDLDVQEYGQTIVTPAFVTKEIQENLMVPAHTVKEAFWWGHQDLYIVHKNT